MNNFKIITNNKIMSYWSDKIIDEQKKEGLTCLRCSQSWNIGKTTIRIPGGGNLNKQRKSLLKENSSCPNCGNIGKWYIISNNDDCCCCQKRNYSCCPPGDRDGNCHCSLFHAPHEHGVTFPNMTLNCCNCRIKYKVRTDEPKNVCPKCKTTNWIIPNTAIPPKSFHRLAKTWEEKGLVTIKEKGENYEIHPTAILSQGENLPANYHLSIKHGATHANIILDCYNCDNSWVVSLDQPKHNCPDCGLVNRIGPNPKASDSAELFRGLVEFWEKKGLVRIENNAIIYN